MKGRPRHLAAVAGLSAYGLISTQGVTREVEIDDVGSLCAFLVSDAAMAITGDVHYVDGGFHILA
jgi:enoyl-[acyl-carrier-protein] reductase (NADH)